jgi:diadenosine tetraphosphate (Ap4A) HIT family hydrolase
LIIARNELAAAFPDAFPVSPGHVLIVPRRHEGDFFALTQREQQAVSRLIPAACAWVQAERSPGGCNLGLNVGSVAGQTVPHVHLHPIPRYSGDVPDPRGGVRSVLPGRAPYWNS